MQKMIKNKIFVLFMMFFLIFPSVSFAKEIPKMQEGIYYIDELNVLSNETKEIINEENKKATNGAEVFVVTVNNLDEDIVDYTHKVFSEYKIGDKKKNNGLLILIAEMPDKSHKIQVMTGYGLEELLPDGKVGRIIDNVMMKDLSNQNIDAGIRKGFIAFFDIINKGDKSPYYKQGFELAPIIVIFILVGTMLFLAITFALEKYREHKAKKYKEKIKYYDEKDLRLEYSKIKKNYLKDVVLDLLKNNLLNKNIPLNQIIKKYQDEEISGLDKTYSEMIKKNEEVLNEVSIRKYLKKFKNKDIEDALLCKLVDCKKDELSLLNDFELIEKHNIGKDLIYRAMYEKELQVRIRNKKYSEKELLNLVKTSTYRWLKNIFLLELALNIKGADPFRLDKVISENDDPDILEIYKKELEKTIDNMDTKKLRHFNRNSRSSFSKSSSGSKLSSRSSGGGSSGGGGAGRSF